MSRLLALAERYSSVLQVALYVGLVYYALDTLVPAVSSLLYGLLCVLVLVLVVVSSVRERRARARARRDSLANLARGAAQ